MYDQKDVYIEQIVKRRPDAMGILIRAGLVLAMLIVPSICLFFEFLGTVFPFILVGSVWGGVYLIMLQSVEYEYIVTNGEMDVDKIMGRRKRKRLMTVSARDFEIFAPLTEEYKNEYGSASIRKKIDVSSSLAAEGLYFAIFTKDAQRTLLVFEPGEKVVGALKPFVMRGALKLR